MDRHLRRTQQVSESRRSFRDKFVKDARLFRSRKGKVVAALPRDSASLPASGRTIYNPAIRGMLDLLPEDSAYILAGDVCTLEEYEALCGQHCTLRISGRMPNAPRSFMPEGTDSGRSSPEGSTSTRGSSTPDICWSPASCASDLQEIEVDEFMLDEIFHQYIDVGQCE